MSNPFHNPWGKNNNAQGYSGPVYGNAYEEDSNQNLNPNTGTNMPSPNTRFTNSGYYNAWGQEEAPQQTHVEPQQQQHHYPPPPSSPNMQNSSPYSTQPNPYQYTGTPHGNNNNNASAYAKYNTTPSPQPAHMPSPEPNSRQSETFSRSSRFARNRVHEDGTVKVNGRPNKWRLLLRFIMFICSIGHLGFAAGARPYSGEDVPFSTSSCFYYLFAVAVLSIIYSGFHLLYSCWRCVANKSKMKRPVMFGLDVLFAVLWGIGIIIEIAKYQCTWGGKFCTFYNVSIFWGFTAFVAYILSSFWDIVGACRK